MHINLDQNMSTDASIYFLATNTDLLRNQACFLINFSVCNNTTETYVSDSVYSLHPLNSALYNNSNY